MCDHMHPHKTGSEGVFTQTHIVDVIKGEIGMICPQVKLRWKEQIFLLNLSRKCCLADTLISEFSPPYL